ncbi:YcjF family protein [Aureimonas frigidaquae]|uniref:YcjF family protein n=1 Tax=Aureimonas frigidaquae TaxID=424757 RepID=UPI000784A0CB|nr:TIGR01620 family protein [Aureimonas frigidaquae]
MSDDPDMPYRGPRSFRPPEATAVTQPVPARAPRAVRELSRLSIEPDDALEREALDALDAAPGALRPRRHRLTFGKLFMAGLGLVVSLATGLALDSLIRDFFARAEWLGWAAAAASAILVTGAVGVVWRELSAILKLRRVEEERIAAKAAFDANDDRAAERVTAQLVSMLAHQPATFAGRERLAQARDDVMDGRDRITLAERELLVPLDAQARALLMASAKRVSVVTAVSPRAIVDLAFVLFETVGLIRRMSELYGARPGTLGLVRLTRDVLAHLAVTGSIAIGDSLIQQVVGQGLAQRLSARLGEGVVNGLLTARIGLAAMDMCRPMPFIQVERPGIGSILKALTVNDPQPGERKD